MRSDKHQFIFPSICFLHSLYRLSVFLQGIWTDFPFSAIIAPSLFWKEGFLLDYVHLKGTGLAVSKACLGTMTFGGQVNEADSIRIIHAALDCGINFVDTADLYYHGESETVTGKALLGRRENVILATKVFNPMSDDPNDRGLNRRHILDALDKSLRRLQTDYVDIYYLHQPDYRTPIAETLETMDTLVRSGKVRYIGVSNYASWQISDLLACARENHWNGPVVTQNVYNLLTRGIEEELIPQTQTHGLGVVVYNPLMSGLLTGKHAKGHPAEGTRLADNATYHDRYWSDENFDASEALAAVAREAGLTPAELALRWCANQEGINAVLIGVSKLSHLEPNLRAVLSDPLPRDVLEACDRVWNGMKVGTRFRYYR